jgi:hypothetical protein
VENPEENTQIALKIDIAAPILLFSIPSFTIPSY